MKYTKKSVGEKIVELRKIRGLSQKELAAKTDVSASNLSKIENGEHFPSHELLMRIAIVLRADIPFFQQQESFFSHKIKRPKSQKHSESAEKVVEND